MLTAGKKPNHEVITALSKASIDAKLKSKEGKTAFDYAKMNEKVKGTDAYLELKKATF
jgi:hypothetical protein